MSKLKPTSAPKPTSSVTQSHLLLKLQEKVALEEAKEACQKLDKYLPKGDMYNVYRVVEEIDDLYSAVDSAPPDFVAEYREKLAKLLTGHGKFVPIICDSIVKLIKEDKKKPAMTGMSKGSFPQRSDLFSDLFRTHDDLFTVRAGKMFEWAPSHTAKTLQDKKKQALLGMCMGSFHNFPERSDLFSDLFRTHDDFFKVRAGKMFECAPSHAEKTLPKPALLGLCMGSFHNFSDCSDLFREQFGEHEEVIKVMAEKMIEWTPAHLQKTLPAEKDDIIYNFLGIAHNLAILPDNVNKLRKHQYVKAIAPFLKSHNGLYTLSALATLADILNEEECHLLQTSENSIKFLLFKLGNASKSSDRRDAGWSAAELGRTVGRLARNDGNKKMLVTLGALPLLLALTTSKIKIEQEESIEALWVLAFDDKNKPKMVDEPKLIETIDKLRKTTEGKVKKLCNGILWTLSGVLKENDKFKHLVKSSEEKLENKKPQLQEEGHVMISYQWDHQDILKQVRNELQKNKRIVWMDIDNMKGSTLEAMAEAIEGAKVVVMCMSQKYKDSPNCRAEAEYAFTLRRPIIPLIMEKGYFPDGWLGFILGAKLYYDFSGIDSFESKIDELIKGVKHIYDPQSVDKVDGLPIQRQRAVNLHSSPQKPRELDEKVKKYIGQSVGGDSAGPGSRDVLAPPPAVDKVDGLPIQRQKAVKLHSRPQKPREQDEKVKKWTSKQVGTWLKKHNLNGNSKLRKLSGKEIVHLRNLREEAPEAFYQTVKGELKVKLAAMVDFEEAIKDLTE